MADKFIGRGTAMVKVGFIVEGASERIILESADIKRFLMNSGYELVMPVIDAEGGGNLLPTNIEPFIETLRKNGAEEIYVLTDLEQESLPEKVKERIQNEAVKSIFIAVKALEAWFLADTAAMKQWLGEAFNEEPRPEQTPSMPWDYLGEIAKKHGARGTGAKKPMFAKRMVRSIEEKGFNFSIDRAAQHPNCPSVKEFVEYFDQSAQ